jgi:uncharacterized membrane protein YfcA
VPSADIWLTLATLLVAAAVQGFLGFGYGIAAMSGLTLGRDLIHAGGVVNVTGIFVTLLMLWRLRAHVDWRTTLRVGPYILVGVVVGVTALRTFDPTWMVRALGLSVLAIAAWNLARPHLSEQRSRLADAVAGSLGGLLGGAFNVGGPPLIAHLYRRPDAPDTLRGTLQTLFLCISLTRLPTSVAQGLMSEVIWREALVALPAVGLGLLLGIRLGRQTDPARFRQLSWSGFGLLGFLLLLSTLREGG